MSIPLSSGGVHGNVRHIEQYLTGRVLASFLILAPVVRWSASEPVKIRPAAC